MTTADFRIGIDCRCAACGARGDEVEWARLGSGYENGHVLGGSIPEPCGPMLLPEDYETYRKYPTRFGFVSMERRFRAVLDKAREAQR